MAQFAVDGWGSSAYCAVTRFTPAAMILYLEPWFLIALAGG
jgi:hypothetical protein